MLRTARIALWSALPLALLAGGEAAAQNTIRLGQTVTGRLDSGDSTLDDDSYYEIWRFRGQAGDRVTVTLRSDDFDAYLAFGARAGDDCEDCSTDDDGGGGTDSRITTTLPRSGEYEIRVNTLSEGETGDYALTVEEARAGERDNGHEIGEGSEDPVRVTGALRLGQAVSGLLEESDPKLADESFADYWTFRGAAGERVVITMESDEFDTFLAFGRASGTEFESIDSNDDGEDGTNSRLEVTIPASGEYLVRANSLAGGETGAYRLRVERQR